MSKIYNLYHTRMRATPALSENVVARMKKTLELPLLNLKYKYRMRATLVFS